MRDFADFEHIPSDRKKHSFSEMCLQLMQPVVFYSRQVLAFPVFQSEREFMFTTEYTLYFKRAEAFRSRVKQAMYGESTDVQCEYAVSREPVEFKDRLSLNYKPIRAGEKWGENWDSAWFRLSVTVPESFAGKELVLLYDTGGESLIFDAKGTPVYALTGGSVFAENFAKSRYVLGRKNPGESLEFWIESAANGLFGLVLNSEQVKPEHPYGRFVGTLNAAKLAVFRREVWNLFLDLDIAIDLIRGLPESDYRCHRFVRILSRAANVYNETPENAEKARNVLKEILSLRASDSALTAHAVGHAHIDSGWLWPVRETIRKCARTFAAQIDLIEKYPDYVFGASAAQHYAFTKEHYPELYRKIKQAVKEGRWEIQGGMWVEADCNLISGESMVRQFLHGKNFFHDEFGVDVRTIRRWVKGGVYDLRQLQQIADFFKIDVFAILSSREDRLLYGERTGQIVPCSFLLFREIIKSQKRRRCRYEIFYRNNKMRTCRQMELYMD